MQSDEGLAPSVMRQSRSQAPTERRYIMKEFLVKLHYFLNSKENCFISEKVADTEQEAVEKAKALFSSIAPSATVFRVKVEEI